MHALNNESQLPQELWQGLGQLWVERDILYPSSFFFGGNLQPFKLLVGLGQTRVLASFGQLGHHQSTPHFSMRMYMGQV